MSQRYKRERWEVLPSGGLLFRWGVTRNEKPVGVFILQRSAITCAVAACNFGWDHHRIRSELLIKGKDGQIQDSRTYGEDPPGTKG